MEKSRILDARDVIKPGGEHTPQNPSQADGDIPPVPSTPSDPMDPPATPDVPTDPSQSPPSTFQRKPGEDDESYKKRYEDSKTEALRLKADNEALSARNRELEAEVAQTADLRLEAELRNEFQDWDMMDESERTSRREAKKEKIQRQQSEAELDVYRREKQVRHEVKQLMLETEFSGLAARFEDFVEYAVKHKNTDLKVLAKSFLFEDHGKQSADEAAQNATRQGLEDPTGHQPGSAPKDGEFEDGLTEEDLGRLANTDVKKFNEIMKARATARQARAIAGRR